MNAKTLGWIMGAAGAAVLLVMAGGRSRSAAVTRGPSVPPGPRGNVVRTALETVKHPPSPDEIWEDTAPTLVGTGAAYCGGFALWVLHRAGLFPGLPWEPGRGFCHRLPRTSNPQPGDIAYFDRLQHHAVVVGIDGDVVTTVDGNQPGIAIRKRSRDEVTAFFSIADAIV